MSRGAAQRALYRIARIAYHAGVGLLSDMRGYLQRVQAGSTSMLAERSTIDREPLRRLVLEAAADERASRYLASSISRLLWEGDALISEVLQHLADTPGLAAPDELPGLASACLVEVLREYFVLACDAEPGTHGIGRVQSTLVDHAGNAAWVKYMERDEQRVPSPRVYALELGLIQMAGTRPKMAPLGEVFLRLTGADATRWPVAIELLTAIDRDDPWRGHESLARQLLARKTLAGYEHEFRYGVGWPWDNPALARWTGLGLLKHEQWRLKERPDEPDGGESYTVTPFGARLLEELLREPDVPLKSFARALLEDASDAMLDVGPRHGGAAASVVRHTRMLAHEMRNALVPVRFAYDQLWSRLPRDEVRVALHRQHTKITEGIDRALRFVTDAARAVSSFAEEISVFVASVALREACEDVTTSTGAKVELTIDVDAADVHLRGTRPRLIMAIVNILHNSVQAGGTGVKIVAALSRADGDVLVLVLEDGGPGIPEPQRATLFENGRSTHKHGTGHGLALVREVVEQDFSGSVHHETSPLGGARFVLTFPIPSEAT